MYIYIKRAGERKNKRQEDGKGGGGGERIRSRSKATHPQTEYTLFKMR